MLRIGGRFFGALAVFALSLTLLVTPVRAQILPVQLTGTFTSDDQVAFLDFSLAVNQRDILIASFGYAGGILPGGQTVTGGGFDSILTLFRINPDTTFTFLADNDDSDDSALDPTTLLRSDARIALSNLVAGNYRIAVSQFDNFFDATASAALPLAERFERFGDGNFTGGPFLQNIGGGSPDSQRTGNFAISASVAPEPGTLALIGLGFVGAVAVRRRTRR